MSVHPAGAVMFGAWRTSSAASNRSPVATPDGLFTVTLDASLAEPVDADRNMIRRVADVVAGVDCCAAVSTAVTR